MSMPVWMRLIKQSDEDGMRRELEKKSFTVNAKVFLNLAFLLPLPFASRMYSG